MFAQRKKQTALPASANAQTKLHTIHGLLVERTFVGKFQTRGKTYNFSFAPIDASLAQRKLILRGDISIKSAKLARQHEISARLVATQGGVGLPLRRQQNATDTAEIDEKLQQEKGPETDLQPGLHSFDNPKPDNLGRPIVESTGSLSFVGVMYFQLSPLDGKTLGIPLDVSSVQLGGRLAPTDDTARDLQELFSDLVLALGGESPDNDAANSFVEKINRFLKG